MLESNIHPALLVTQPLFSLVAVCSHSTSALLGAWYPHPLSCGLSEVTAGSASVSGAVTKKDIPRARAPPTDRRREGKSAPSSTVRPYIHRPAHVCPAFRCDCGGFCQGAAAVPVRPRLRVPRFLCLFLPLRRRRRKKREEVLSPPTVLLLCTSLPRSHYVCQLQKEDN